MNQNSLEIIIQSNLDLSDMPKLVDITDHELNPIYSKWIYEDRDQVDLDDGVYVVNIKVSSGEKVQKPVRLAGGEAQMVTMNLEDLSPHESQEWAYVSKNLNPQAEEDLSSEKFAGCWMRMWAREAGGWKVTENPVQEDSDWYPDGVNYRLRLPRKLQALQFGGEHLRWKFVMVPPGASLKCLVRPVKDQADTVHPLEVIITSENWKAESLLAFLQSGDMDKAKSLMKDYAEELLYKKMVSPTSAAVGGYFLLKVGAEDRMRNWARNLSNWMDWLPDGAVIRAWQLINQQSGNMEDIKAALLEAVERGIPVYTEGMRLLYQGLKMLYFQDKDNAEVGRAYERVEKYWGATDSTATTTTFTGTHPELPDPESRKGMPDNQENMAFLYSVPLTSMVEAGQVAPQTEIELISNLPETKKVIISAKGTVYDEEGHEFPTVYEAMRTKASEEKITHLEARDLNKGEDLYQNIQPYRLGRNVRKKRPGKG